jgi:uncharacterized membrane protein
MSRSSLWDLQTALDALGAAVRRDDVEAYRAALAQAEEVGATEEQITDAFQWGRKTSHTGWSFDRNGDPV